MIDKKVQNAAPRFEESLHSSKAPKYVLRLYITGTSPRSVRALENVKKMCEEFLQGRYELQVIDLLQQPQLAQGEQIIAAPTLIKKLPHPLRRVIGDMSSTERVLVGLDLRKKSDAQ